MHYVTWLGLWVKVKCLNREEFVVVGWTDPEGARPWLGSLLLAYYGPEGRLVYAGRARWRAGDTRRLGGWVAAAATGRTASRARCRAGSRACRRRAPARPARPDRRSPRGFRASRCGSD